MDTRFELPKRELLRIHVLSDVTSCLIFWEKRIWQYYRVYCDGTVDIKKLN
jgi:hypothetical protein